VAAPDRGRGAQQPGEELGGLLRVERHLAGLAGVWSRSGAALVE
jgi:hypothetical protein